MKNKFPSYTRSLQIIQDSLNSWGFLGHEVDYGVYRNINQDFPSRLQLGVGLEKILCMAVLSAPFYIWQLMLVCLNMLWGLCQGCSHYVCHPAPGAQPCSSLILHSKLAWDRKSCQWQSTAVGLGAPSWFTSLSHKWKCCHREAPDLSKHECLILWVILSSSYALHTIMAITISYLH